MLVTGTRGRLEPVESRFHTGNLGPEVKGQGQINFA